MKATTSKYIYSDPIEGGEPVDGPEMVHGEIVCRTSGTAFVSTNGDAVMITASAQTVIPIAMFAPDIFATLNLDEAGVRIGERAARILRELAADIAVHLRQKDTN